MGLDPELRLQIQEDWNRPPRPLTEQQARRVEWYKARFKSVLESAANEPLSGTHDEVVNQLASYQLLERICHWVDLTAHGTLYPYVVIDGAMKMQLSVHELAVIVGQAIVQANVRPGRETAEFMESLLSPHQTPDGLPDNIKFVHERYVPLMFGAMSPEDYEKKYPDTGNLWQYDFNYFVVVPFPE